MSSTGSEQAVILIVRRNPEIVSSTFSSLASTWSELGIAPLVKTEGRIVQMSTCNKAALMTQLVRQWELWQVPFSAL